MKADIVVIGGGASGFAAAVEAKSVSPYSRIVIAERLSRSGKKIIASGNGKCNLSNANLSADKFHGTIDAMSIIGSTPDYHEFFTQRLGVLCSMGNEGREGGIYPRSNSSSTILSALRKEAERLGAEELCDTEIKEIKIANDGFRLISDSDEIQCKRVIIAAGGYAAPSFGTDGAMLRILKNMGYSTGKICPAVAPLKVNAESVKGLKGVRVKGRISAVSNGKILRTETGEIQFNENTVSGICVFNLAYLFRDYENKLTLKADLLPDMNVREIADFIFQARRKMSDFTIEELLSGMFVKNLAVFIVKKALGKSMNSKISSVTDSEIYSIAEMIKNLEFTVTGCSSWQNAQATYGGIHNKCVTEKLESRLHRGIYFCGEILDVVGDCGGYNLQWAWSSGMWAGRNCALSLKGGRNGKNK